MVATRPSTMSCWDGRSGSISWIERVPSELRTASTLATCLADTQADSDDVPAGQRGLVGSGLASKFVLEVAVAVKVPRLGEVMVTVLALRLTMPVKSLLQPARSARGFHRHCKPQCQHCDHHFSQSRHFDRYRHFQHEF